jgi:hypothetical protein
MWKDCHGRGTPSRKRVGPRALGVRFPLLPPLEAWPSWKGSALLARRRLRRPQVRVLLPPSPPRSSAAEQWASNPRAPVRSGPGRPCSCAGCRSPSGDRRPRESETLACQDELPAAGRRSFSVSITSSELTSGCPNSMRRRSTVGRPVVTRTTLVRSQPSQPPTPLPRSSNGRGRRSLTPEARVRFPLGVLHTARPRTRLETRPGCLPGEAGSTPVEGVLLAVAQW